MSSITRSFDNASTESKRARLALRALWLALPLAALFVLAGCETPSATVKNTSHTYRTVVIDAGHGGQDNGTRSRWGGTEKSAALDTALRIAPKLRAAGFNTVLTRDGDFFVPLEGRTRISNSQENAIFVSVHFNEGPNRAAHGVETYYRSPFAHELAARIESTVTSLPGVASRGVKTANYWVLRNNEYPAVLIEGGFFSNPKEGARCATPAYREALANAIANAIITERGPLPPAQSSSSAIATTATPGAAGPMPIPATR
jgi:N-acetylmuramoyl-L-alanine amidase